MESKNKCIVIPDDFEGYEKDHFLIPPHYQDSVSHVLIPRGVVLDRTEKLAYDIFHDIMKDGRESITMLCVLIGGYQFCLELQDRLNLLNSNSASDGVKISLEFIRLKSYVNSDSSGKMNIVGLENLNAIRGKNILIVEDIVDTGRTMEKLLNTITDFQPKSVTVAALLRKRTIRSSGYIPEYVGFEIPDRFVIGHGFDYNEFFRDMLHICVINDHGIEKYKQ